MLVGSDWQAKELVFTCQRVKMSLLKQIAE